MRRLRAAAFLGVLWAASALAVGEEPVRVAEWKASHAFRPGDRLEVEVGSGIVRVWGDPGTAMGRPWRTR